MNHVKTFILIAAMTALFMTIGFMIGGVAGMALAFVFAAGMNLFTYWNADSIVLRTYHAREVEADDPNPQIQTYVADVEALAVKADLPRPRICIIDNDQPNAFATGRDPAHAAVCATTGLLAMLSRDEVRGVMAHELAHVKNRDTLTMTITATFAGAIGALANFGMFFGGNDRDRPGGLIGTLALAILAPLAAALVQMAISRSREYEADRVGAEIAGDPQALARALQKIEGMGRAGVVNHDAERNPATAHMFIINPLSGAWADNLFSTHPATANRVEALMTLAASLPARTQRGTAVPTTRDWVEKGPWG
jgi:heat shock protein HtpX